MKEEEWDFMYSVNVKGALFCYKQAAEQMIKQGRGGRIICEVITFIELVLNTERTPALGMQLLGQSLGKWVR